jgi:hypothetical protein
MPDPTVLTKCEDCTRLLSKVEALTFEQARIHNSLNIADLCGDRFSARKLTLRAYEINKERQDARDALAIHEAMHRPLAAGVAGRGTENHQ